VRNRHLPLAGLAVAVLLATGSAAGAAPRVVTSILPVHALVGEVMAGVAEPVLLVPPGASPHGYQMRPSEAAALQEAELVVWIGPDLETYLVRPLASLAGGARQLQLTGVPGMTLLPAREGGVWAQHDHDGDHDHDAGHDHDAAHDEHGHDHGHEHAHGAAPAEPIDPHIWLSLANAGVIVDAVAAALAEIDPGNAATYAANAAGLRTELRSLADELEDTLKPVRERPFVVAHDAWQYMEREFGLRVVGSITVSPDRPPSAQRLSELRRTISERGAACVFAEPQYRTDLVEVLVEGTGARAGILDPLGAVVWPAAGGRYADLMRANAAALAGCLSTGS
jgi:zinc transport system substrate-binding protein